MFNALGEYLYYGQEIFEEKKAMFADVIQKMELECYLTRPLPDYENMLEDYREASKDIVFRY